MRANKSAKAGAALWSGAMRTLTFNSVVGSGAMGTVYHAELRAPQGFARTCAVKVMKSAQGDHEQFVTRMRDEARLLGMLQAESILGVSELIRVEGRDAVVMEFVDGADLSDLREGSSMPPRALAELGAELAGTLHRAHVAVHPRTGEPLRVIHRDVKPANIMVTKLGGLRLLDFGVARAAFGGRESHTHGLVLGTLNYFAPEIFVGTELTPAVDMYGLGLTLWEAAAGRDWGQPVVKRAQYAARVERRLASLSPDYAPLTDVLRGLLAFDAADRMGGEEAEAALLTLADALRGAGLRTWARDAVSSVLKARATSSREDPLVGRTIELGGGEALGANKTKAPPSVKTAVAVTPVSPVTPKPKAGGVPLWAMAAIGVVLGVAIAAALLVLAGGAFWLSR